MDAEVKDEYRPSADYTREAVLMAHTCASPTTCELCHKRDALITQRIQQLPDVPPPAGPCWAKPHTETSKVEDFKGVIDGAGVKAVMTDPKCPLEQIPPQFMEGIAEVLKHGMKKYARLNWMRGMSWETVAGGMARHLSAFRRGEEMDPESGLPHLFHLACGTMFLAWYAHGPQQDEHRKLDDRAFKAAP